MNHKYLALALMVITGFVPVVYINAQTTASSQTTRAQEILNRNNARNAQIGDRDQDKLQAIDDKLEFEYKERLLAQINASSQDIQANLFSLYTIFNNVKVRLNNVITVLNDLDIATKKTAGDISTDPLASGIAGLVAFNVQEKYDNFLKCFDGSGPAANCVVYELPASQVEVNLDGLQASSTLNLDSASTNMISQLERIGGPGSVAPTTIGTGYANQVTASAWVPIPFQPAYRILRDEAVTAGAITIPGIWVACGRPNLNLGTAQECEFTDPESFDKAVKVQINKLKTELSVLEGTFINTRQAVRAFVYDVVEALEFHLKTQEKYDPRNGEEGYDPRNRQGAQ